MENRNIARFHLRGQRKCDSPQGDYEKAILECETLANTLIKEEKLMTAALYHYHDMLFLYYESIGTEIEPENFMKPLHPFLETWPVKSGVRDWAKMYHIYYHAIPEGAKDWKRKTRPEQQRGRIALLKEENMFEYVYHHFAIVEEGLLQGDKYQSIALHEDILFSYFEEPRIPMNIKRDFTKESQTIQGWLDVIPEDHFIQLPEGKSPNFLLLPAHFTLGQEES